MRLTRLPKTLEVAPQCAASRYLEMNQAGIDLAT